MRADRENLPGLLHGVMDLERLFQIARHRLFAIDVLAGVHRIDGDRSVPRIVGGNDDSVDVAAFQKLPVVGERVGVLEAGFFLRPIAALAEEVARSGYDDVVLGGVLVDAFEVVLADAVADADNGDVDAVIGTNDPARGGSLALAIHGGLDDARGGDRSGDCGGFLDEGPAGIAAGGWFAGFVIHDKTWFVFVSVLLADVGKHYAFARTGQSGFAPATRFGMQYCFWPSPDDSLMVAMSLSSWRAGLLSPARRASCALSTPESVFSGPGGVL